jgi:type IV pilus assembly protein PilA
MLRYQESFVLIKRRSGGFTLIELMLVISIIAILVALAVPAYQEYSTRAKVTECMVGAAPAKLAVSEYMSTVGSWPPDMDSAALSSGNVSKYCSGFASYDRLTGSFQINVNELAIYPTLGTVQPQLTPQVTSVTTISWRCSRGATGPNELKYLPSTCRGT